MLRALWYEDDRFWQAMAPFIFDAKRWAEAPADVDQIQRLAPIASPARVLDLCCGPGRYSLEFARRGFSVTAVDRTLPYLDEARRRAADEKLDIDFVQEDMRHFCRPLEFDFALSLFTSFGYFEDPEDDRRVLLNLHRSLKPGGALLIDVMGKEVLARIFRQREWDEQDGAIFLRETNITQDWGWIDSRWILLSGTTKEEFKISHRLYGGTDLAGLLQACEFPSVRIFGDLSGAPYNQNARRLIALATKPPG